MVTVDLPFDDDSWVDDDDKLFDGGAEEEAEEVGFDFWPLGSICRSGLRYSLAPLEAL